MKSLMKGLCMGLLLMSTVAYAGNGKPATKKAQTTQTCGPNCPHPCNPATCPKGCCHKS